MDSKLNLYRTTETLGKSQLDLVLEVYDGALKSLQKAKEAAETGNAESFTGGLDQMRKCVTHLYTTLDFVKGGEIAEQLGKLYAFVLSEADLIQATQDTQQIDKISKVLKNLRSGWADINDEIRASTPKKGTAESIAETVHFSA